MNGYNLEKWGAWIAHEKVRDEVSKERRRQDQLWQEQNHSPEVWGMILMEEVGEVARAWLETGKAPYRDGLYDAYRAELVQVAAVAIAAIESFDRGKWRD